MFEEWQFRLALHLTHIFSCGLLVSADHFVIVGKEADRRNVIDRFKRFDSLLPEMTEEYLNPPMGEPVRLSFGTSFSSSTVTSTASAVYFTFDAISEEVRRRSYLCGLVEGLAQRIMLSRMKERPEARQTEEQGEASGGSLAVVDNRPEQIHDYLVQKGVPIAGENADMPEPVPVEVDMQILQKGMMAAGKIVLEETDKFLDQQ